MYKAQNNGEEKTPNKLDNLKTSYNAKKTQVQEAYNAKREAIQKRIDSLPNPKRTVNNAKKTVIKKGVKTAASVAGIPAAATEQFLQGEQAEEILNAAAQASSVQEGVQIVVKKIAAKQTKKIVASMSLVFLLPFLIIILFVGKSSDGISYVQGEKMDGYEQLYDAVDKVTLEMSTKYGVQVNKYLIISAMTSVMNNDEYSNENNENIEVETKNQDDQLTTMSVRQLENKVRLLALYQIQTNKAGCNMQSDTVRQVAKNDDAGYFIFSTAVSKEKNYNCNSTSDSFIASFAQGTPDNDNSGGVFYWNLMDEDFLTDYYKDHFNGLNEEDKLTRKLEYIDYIYSYAKMLEDGQLTSQTSAGSCEYDSIIVKLYECDTPTDSIFNQNPPEDKFIEAVPFEDYIIGVMVVEAGVYNGVHKEYTGAQNIIARTYALNRTSYKPGVSEIHLRACTYDQVHCNYKTGCSKASAAEGGTWYPGLNYSGKQMGPVSDEEWIRYQDKFRGIVMKKADGSFMSTPYRTEFYDPDGGCRMGFCLLAQPAIKLDQQGMTYEQILKHYYSGENFTLSSNCKDFGDEKRFGDRGQVITGETNYMKTHFITNVNFNNMDVEFDGVKYNLNKNSSGPASLSMIVNALSSGFKPLYDFFSGVTEPYANTNEIKIVAMMHRYLYKISLQEELGASKTTTYDNRAVEMFNIKSLGEFKQGSFTVETIKDHLKNKRLILVNYDSNSCPAGTSVCQGIGSTAGQSFSVIFGYNGETDRFMVHNPSSYYGAHKEVDADIVATKIASITVYESVGGES